MTIAARATSWFRDGMIHLASELHSSTMQRVEGHGRSIILLVLISIAYIHTHTFCRWLIRRNVVYTW